MVTRDTEWGTFDGRRIPIKHLSNAHLANIIAMMRVNFTTPSDLFKVLLQEAKDRELPQEYLDLAPYPFLDTDGRWKTLNFKTGKAEEVLTHRPEKI